MTNDNLSQLWDDITPKLYGYLINTLRDRDLAGDILQNTWLKAIEALPNFKGGDKEFSSWLFTIARNECRQYWRKGGREISFDPEVHDVEDVDSGIEDKIMVDQVLSRLSESDRELMQLRYISGLPLDNIAKILKINPVAVRVRMHRAKNALKATLKNI